MASSRKNYGVSDVREKRDADLSGRDGSRFLVVIDTLQVSWSVHSCVMNVSEAWEFCSSVLLRYTRCYVSLRSESNLITIYNAAKTQ
jgi:hypothetical protein